MTKQHLATFSTQKLTVISNFEYWSLTLVGFKRCVKSVCSELFWSAFSRIRTEYGEILRISVKSLRSEKCMQTATSELFFLFFNFIPFKISVFLVKKPRLYIFLKIWFTLPPSPKIEIKERTQVLKIRNIKITSKQFSSIYNSKYISKTISKTQPAL